mmetsp:Transcript_32395/g.109161  ORF Transcript_32395/g.109161 Transcript_32395/m.109161 type:complete len:278 (+) Transcript_32395:541-1374(+)
MRLEEFGHLLGRLGLLAAADEHGLAGLERCEGGLRGHDVAVHVLRKVQLRVHLSSRARDAPAHRLVVAVKVLGRRVQRHVAAKVDGLDHDRRRERGVAAVRHARSLGDGRHRREVGQRQRRVGRRLGVDELRLAGDDGGRDVGRVAEVDEREFNAKLHKLHASQAVRAAVRAVRQDAVVARRQESGEDGDRSRHARGEASRARPVLQRRDLLLQRLNRRVRRARVRVALGHVLVDGLLHERRRLVDGRQDGARLLAGRDARVDALRLEAQRAIDPSA